MTSGFFRTTIRVAALFSLLVTPCLFSAQTPKATAMRTLSSSKLSAAYGRLPLAFEPNRGQTDSRVQFLARTPQATVFVAGSDAVLQTNQLQKDARGVAKFDRTAYVRMHLLGAAATPADSAEQVLSGTVSWSMTSSLRRMRMRVR